MFIYCFYRHVNHLNGNYVMKISWGWELGASVIELIWLPKRWDYRRQKKKKQFWTFNDMWLHVNLSLSIQTGTLWKQHGACWDERLNGCSTFLFWRLLAIIRVKSFHLYPKNEQRLPEKRRKMKIYIPCREISQSDPFAEGIGGEKMMTDLLSLREKSGEAMGQ